ncbi:MAG: S-layer homology domain-containing protein [Oscillospiraceae bacterium]|nr:S-layer homology domain-containing protein [Clostridiales bacterium]MDY2718853.1 S-layer homology domain-containing protein [Oscillospiraceae bacterium]
MKPRRLLIGFLTVLLLSAAVSAAECSDVSDTHWANEQIVYLQDEITGYPDGTFRPEKTVSRAEFLTLFARIAFPDEWKQAEGDEWWKAAYDVCTAHRLLDDTAGSRSEAMPRGEIAALLDRFCSGWGGVHERADAAIQHTINWKEQRMESPEWQPLFPDAAEYGNSVLISANQGLLTGYPDGSFKPGKGVTRAEAAAILARLKAQLALREKGCEYVCTVGAYWLMQYSLSGSVGLGLYEPLTGKTVQTVGLWKAAQGVNGYVAFDRLLSGSDGIYVWGRAGLYKRSGNTLEQIVAEPVLDFCWYGDNTLYYLSWDDTKPIPAYVYAAVYSPCASRVMKLENPGQNAVRSILAERDESSPTQNLTDIYVEYGTLYVAGSYCMGIADLHAALYEVKDGTLVALFGEY